MEILSVMNCVVTRLREHNPEMDVFISSTDAQKYIPQTQQVAVIVKEGANKFLI